MTDCFGLPKRPWYARLWRWLFPVRTAKFERIRVPLCLVRHPTREALARTIVGEKK